MASSLDSLREMTSEEIRARFQASLCAVCKCGLCSRATGIQSMDGKIVCDSCYFADLGAAIEESPIGVPRRRRGHPDAGFGPEEPLEIEGKPYE